MDDANCPYCGTGQEIDHDGGSYGYEEGETHQQECPECEKTFAFQTSIIFSYKVQKAPCLNDGEHDWKRLFTTRPGDWQRCSACDERRRKPAEHSELGRDDDCGRRDMERDLLKGEGTE